MAETPAFPRKDAQGRVVAIVDLFGVAFAGLVLGAVVLVAIDGLLALFGLGEFGRLSGWLIGILPIWLLADDVRAWKGVRYRVPVALGAAVFGIVFGSLVAAPVSFLPPLASGAVGATVAVLLYVIMWFYGVRRLP